MSEKCAAIVPQLAELLVRKHLTCATAESCTGGLAGSVLTGFPGSSAWYLGGVISYSNSVKSGLLGVPESVLESNGAVSSQVVEAMASGVCGAVGADVSCSVSGVAGPGGGTPEKPVGTVWIGWCVKGTAESELFHFSGDRAAVRIQAAEAALAGLVERVRRLG